MKNKILYVLFALILLQAPCYGQIKDTGVWEPVFAPCFQAKYPSVIDLPDSFDLKDRHLYANLLVSVYYDSTGKILETNPQILTLKRSAADKISQYFWQPTKDSIVNITNEEVNRFASWTKEYLPQIISFNRYKPSYRCTQKVSTRNHALLEFKLK